MSRFQIVSDFKPTGDQPQAVSMLVAGLNRGEKHQVLLGVTGSGKTFTMANVIEKVQKPTLIISHNKTLAGQLAQEFRSIFPQNAVEYFVSYYDYYQPEAYVPQSDTYIEKETQINEEIEKLRLSATTSLLTRKDVIVVASVSAIYNLGSPVEYGGAILEVKMGMKAGFDAVLKILSKMFYQRNDIDFKRGSFRVKGDTVDIFPAYMDSAYRIQFLGEKVEKVSKLNPVTGDIEETKDTQVIYPAKHYITPDARFLPALVQIERDLEKRLSELRTQNKLLEAQRLEQRTHYDLEMMREFGYCNGIENYSRYFEGRTPGDPPYTLMEYFSKDFLLIIDESHITLPQIRGMYAGDRSRKETLVEFGFRLPSALDNRPLKYEEFQRKINQAVYVSATPDEYELSLAGKDNVAEQLIRPTGILDPEIDVRPTEGQIDDVLKEIKKRIEAGERVLITTLTKRMAEDLSDYLKEKDVKVEYLHSDIVTLKRSDILESLRLGEFDVIVGINLLREGLDLPEVSLVVILDADKEGFLRSRTSLIQTMGRAARHTKGQVLMYADNMTKSMYAAIEEVERRRKTQEEYNKKHNITPKSIEKALRDRLIEKVEELQETLGKEDLKLEDIPVKERQKMVGNLQEQMKQAAELLDFEEAARIRDQIRELSVWFDAIIYSMQQTPDNTPLPDPEVRQEAHRLVQELEQSQGKKALLLILNSDPLQREYLSSLFKEKGQEKDVAFVVSAKENPNDIVTLYKAFREVDSLGNPNTVVLMINRALTPAPGVSVNVAKEIDDLSKVQGWDTPLIVSSSSQDMWNMQMQKHFPEAFVGVYRNDSAPIIDAIATRL